MATEPKRAEKARDNGNGIKAADALARDVADAQSAGADAAKATSHTVVAAFKQQADTAADLGVDLVKHVAADVARAHTAAGEKSEAAGKAVVDAAADTAGKATQQAEQAVRQSGELTQKAAEAGRETFKQSAQAISGWQKQFAGFGTGQQFLGTTARVMDIFRGASEETSANARALANTYVHLGRGMQGLQKTYVELLERAAKRAATRPMDLLRCKSFEELARVQRDMYVDGLNYSLEATGTLLEAAGAVAQDALKSLQERSRSAP